MLRYSDLTKEQKDKITNGCGSKGGLIKPPSFIFKASCNHHDFLYWLGGDESDRIYADDTFYKYMKIDIEGEKWYSKPFHHAWAYIYYKAVRIFGKKYFYFTENKRTLADI